MVKYFTSSPQLWVYILPIMYMMGDSPIQMSREDAERSLRALGERLALLTGGEERLDNATSNAVSFISDTVSGAGQYRDYYERDARLAGNELRRARAALGSGDLRAASRFLNSAAEHIESAGSEWKLYLNASAEGRWAITCPSMFMFTETGN